MGLADGPGNRDVQPAYSTYSGKGWYRRTFTVPAAWQGQRIRICFVAVNHQPAVPLNGHDLGTHVRGYTPFEFDVIDQVVYGGDNTVVAYADIEATVKDHPYVIGFPS